MSDTDNFDDVAIIAKTANGEARGESIVGMHAVINVMENRANDGRWPDTMREVCLQPKQFSCWNANDPNRAKILAVTEADAIYAKAVELAREALNGDLVDITDGATHYLVTGTHANWAVGQTPCKIYGHHSFYNDIA